MSLCALYLRFSSSPLPRLFTQSASRPSQQRSPLGSGHPCFSASTAGVASCPPAAGSLRAGRLHFTASLEEAATAAANGDLGESSEEEEEDGEGDENKDGENDDDDASSSGDSCGASASSGNDDVGGGSSSTSRDEAKALKREVEAERKEVAKFAAAQRKAHEKTRAKEEAKQDAANGGGRHALLEAKVAMVADALVPGMVSERIENGKKERASNSRFFDCARLRDVKL